MYDNDAYDDDEPSPEDFLDTLFTGKGQNLNIDESPNGVEFGELEELQPPESPLEIVKFMLEQPVESSGVKLKVYLATLGLTIIGKQVVKRVDSVDDFSAGVVVGSVSSSVIEKLGR